MGGKPLKFRIRRSRGLCWAPSPRLDRDRRHCARSNAGALVSEETVQTPGESQVSQRSPGVQRGASALLPLGTLNTNQKPSFLPALPGEKPAHTGPARTPHTAPQPPQP